MTGAEPQDADRRATEWSPRSFQPDPSSPYYVRPPRPRRLRVWGAFLIVVPVPAFAVAVVVALVQRQWGAAALLGVMLLVFAALRWYQLTRIRAELRRRKVGSDRRTAGS